MALKKDGSLWFWGNNGITKQNTPVQLGTDKDWQMVAAGGSHAVALKDGTLWTWGENGSGQLGDGTDQGKDNPVQVGADKDWQTVAAGAGHTVAVKTNGEIWTWGSNEHGQLGDWTTKQKNRPAQISIDRQYIDHGDGTITDTKTGLMWKRCSEGLSGVNCENGMTETYEWNDAVNRFKNIEYADYKGWRLPTIKELKTLISCSKWQDASGYCEEGSEQPTINQQAFPNTPGKVFWSGSPDADNSDCAWGIDFNDGHSGTGDRSFNFAVRLVRGGQ